MVEVKQDFFSLFDRSRFSAMLWACQVKICKQWFGVYVHSKSKASWSNHAFITKAFWCYHTLIRCDHNTEGRFCNLSYQLFTVETHTLSVLHDLHHWRAISDAETEYFYWRVSSGRFLAVLLLFVALCACALNIEASEEKFPNKNMQSKIQSLITNACADKVGYGFLGDTSLKKPEGVVLEIRVDWYIGTDPLAKYNRHKP